MSRRAVLHLCAGVLVAGMGLGWPMAVMAQEQRCEDTCLSATDGVCDDGGPLSQLNTCEYGTDCADCGPRTPLGIELFQTELAASRSVWEGLRVNGEASVYCIHRSYFSLFGDGYRSTAEFDGDELVWWSVEQYDSSGPPTVYRGTSASELRAPYMIQTMEQLYDTCETDLLRRPGTFAGAYGPTGNELEFAVDHRGLMSVCSAQAHACFDDCIESIDLDRLELGPCERSETPPEEVPVPVE